MRKMSPVAIILIACIAVSAVFQSVLFDRVCVLVILIVCVRLGLKESYFVNPYMLFALTPISLLFYYNFGNVYMLDLSHSIWLLGIMNMVAFILALYWTPSISIKSDTSTQFNNNNTLRRHAVFLFLVSLILYVVPEMSSVLWMLFVPAMVCAIKTKEKGMCLLALAYVLFTALSGNTSKMEMLLFVLLFLICYEKYFVETTKQRKIVKYMTVFCVFFMIFAFSFANKERGHYDADRGLDEYIDRGIEWEYDSKLFLPYMYLTNGWTNLQFVAETQDTRTYGLWLAKPFLGYLQQDEKFEDMYQLSSFSSFNTFGFITCGFKDFGYWLSFISAIILGVFVKRVYSRFRKTDSPLDTASYVLVSLATLEMFFSNHFLMQSYPITIVIEMALYKFVFASKLK